MAAGETLVFAGTSFAFATIEVIDRHQLPSVEGLLSRPLDESLAEPMTFGRVPKKRNFPRPAPAGTILSLAVNGGARPWTTSEPAGFWRSFAALDYANPDEDAVMRFVRKRGDPFGDLAVRGRTETGRWVAPMFDLAQVARAWQAPNRAGVSVISKDEQRLDHAHEVLATILLPLATKECDVVTDKTVPDAVRRALTLRAFMVLSAASALKRGMPMRQCLQCTEWLELRRRDMKFCSASCRAAYSTAKQQEKK